MRIQAYFEMKHGVFANFKLASFRDNDQGSTLEALEVAGKGDLLIRDLGYFALEAFREYIDKGVHLLSRLQLSSKLFDPDTGEEIDLLARLRSRGSILHKPIVGVHSGGSAALAREHRWRGSRGRSLESENASRGSGDSRESGELETPQTEGGAKQSDQAPSRITELANLPYHRGRRDSAP